MVVNPRGALRSLTTLGVCSVLALMTGAAATSSPKMVAEFAIARQAVLSPYTDVPLAVDWTIHRPSAPAAKLHLIVVYFPRGTVDVTVRAVKRQGDAVSLISQADCPAAAITVNGGFYVRDGKGARPLGLVRINGATQSPPSGRRFGGFLTGSAPGLAVLKRAEVARAVAAPHAIESSPLVVEAGASGIRSDNGEVFDRVAIGTSADGGALVVGVFGQDQETVTLREFANLAAGGAALIGHPAANLLAMDGGPSAHIRLGAIGSVYGYRGPAFLPNVVCLAKR